MAQPILMHGKSPALCPDYCLLTGKPIKEEQGGLPGRRGRAVLSHPNRCSASAVAFAIRASASLRCFPGAWAAILAAASGPGKICWLTAKDITP